MLRFEKNINSPISETIVIAVSSHILVIESTNLIFFFILLEKLLEVT